MKWGTPFLLVLLLSGCASSLADVRQGPAYLKAEFPTAPAASLAYCTLQELQESSGPLNHLILVPFNNPAQTEYVITATESVSAFGGQGVGYELRFVTHAQSTTAELRQGSVYQWMLDQWVWPIVQLCSRQQPPPTETPR